MYTCSYYHYYHYYYYHYYYYYYYYCQRPGATKRLGNRRDSWSVWGNFVTVGHGGSTWALVI